MALLAELRDKKTICIYRPEFHKDYKLRSTFELDREIDDFYIDRRTRLYPIINRNIYALRHEYILIASDIYDYKVIDTEYGCLFFWVELDKKTNNENNTENLKYRIVCREINDEVEPEKELKRFDSPDFKIIVINRKNYILYNKNKILAKYEDSHYEHIFDYEIKKACYIKERLISVDAENNIQMFHLRHRQNLSGFKSLGNVIDIVASKFITLVGVSTDEGIFAIDINGRNILKKKMKNELQFNYHKIFFIDKRTLLIYGTGVTEWHLVDGEMYRVVAEKSMDCFYKYVFYSQGFEILKDFKVPRDCECKCYDLILDMKCEMRREIFKLNVEIDELRKKVENENESCDAKKENCDLKNEDN